jgi:glycosyltransferase involved in cell wall biosynthesis
MKILIAIITYNECQNINKVISELSLYSDKYDLLFIDNSSYDYSKTIFDKEGKEYLMHSINTGGGFGTVTTYFLYAYRYNYDIVCQFDGDGQHIGEELNKIIEPILKGEADYVIGSRFLEKKGFQSYFFRRLGIKLFAKLDSLLIGKTLTDVTSGFKAYNKKVIDLFGNFYKHEIYDSNQMILLSHYAGAKILEVPVKMKERQIGKSEYNMINSITYPFKGIVNILGTVLQKKIIKKYINSQNGN